MQQLCILLFGMLKSSRGVMHSRCLSHVSETFWSVLMSQSTKDQALDLLQHLCANDLDVPVGHIVHTGMLNERGGYENDCSVVRLSKNRFVTPRQLSY